MKISEIIAETRLPIRKSLEKAAPSLQVWPDLDNGNVPYLQYRMGLALAIAPNHNDYNEGPVGGQFMTLAFSDADQEIIDGAAKIMKVKPIDRSGKRSEELDSTQKFSPTRKVGAITKPNSKK